MKEKTKKNIFVAFMLSIMLMLSGIGMFNVGITYNVYATVPDGGFNGGTWKFSEHIPDDLDLMEVKINFTSNNKNYEGLYYEGGYLYYILDWAEHINGDAIDETSYDPYGDEYPYEGIWTEYALRTVNFTEQTAYAYDWDNEELFEYTEEFYDWLSEVATYRDPNIQISESWQFDELIEDDSDGLFLVLKINFISSNEDFEGLVYDTSDGILMKYITSYDNQETIDVYDSYADGWLVDDSYRTIDILEGQTAYLLSPDNGQLIDYNTEFHALLSTIAEHPASPVSQTGVVLNITVFSISTILLFGMILVVMKQKEKNQF